MARLKIDLHVHSNLSPDALHSIRHLAVKAKERGLDGIAVCDHNRISQDDFSLPNFLIMRGMEYSALEGHILLLGIPRDFAIARGLPAASAARQAELAGGVSIAAHAYSVRKWGQSMRGRAFQVGATALERFNGSDFIHNIIASRKIPRGTGGSDAHSVYEVGNAYTELECEPRESEVLEEIRKGRMKAVLAQRPLSIMRRKWERFWMKREKRRR